MRGGEAILDALCELFPQAELFTLLQTDFKMSPRILAGRKVHHSYLQKFMKVPRFQQGYRSLLPLFPHAISKLDLSSFDLVVSNTHCVAKGAKSRPGAVHISYVSTPMRYMWDLFDDYFGPGRAGLVTRSAANLLRKPLQEWDVRSTQGVDALAANSNFVRERIEKFWGRDDAEVVNPFVDVDRFSVLGLKQSVGDFYLIVSAFAPYKRIDIAIEAFRRLGLPLLIVGRGQDEERLRGLSKGLSKIQFLGGLSNSAIAELYQKSRALIFPGLEDFGITPLESMASGRPVIGYGKGGLLDTVTSDTGILFPEQSADSLVAAVRDFEARISSFSSERARARAKEFSREVFLEKFSRFAAAAITRGPRSR
jgi:glycosyltransferase involved in cell wall biosynthesis